MTTNQPTLVTLFLFSFLLPHAAGAQGDEEVENPRDRTGFGVHEQVHEGPGGSRLSIFNGGLNIGLPIYSAPIGGDLAHGLMAAYNSKSVIRRDHDPGPHLPTYDDTTTELGIGWRFTMGRVGWAGGGQIKYIYTPDGSPHAIYPLNHGTTPSHEEQQTQFVTRDGSKIRVVLIPDHPEQPETLADYTTRQYKAFLPNGTIVEYNQRVWHDPQGWWDDAWWFDIDGWYATAITDVHGNRIDISYHDPPHQHVIKTITDSECRTITTEIHDVWAAEQLRGKIKSVTYPIFDLEQDNEPCEFDTATVTFEYEIANYEHPLVYWAPHLEPRTVAFLREVRMPHSKTHEFFYNDHGELSQHRIPTGAVVEYDHGYIFDDPSQLESPSRQNRGVHARRINTEDGRVAEWRYLRFPLSPASTCAAPPPYELVVRTQDPEQKWTWFHYLTGDDDISDPAYWYSTSDVLRRVVVWDRPWTSESELDDCLNPPAAPYRTTDYKWEQDEREVPYEFWRPDALLVPEADKNRRAAAMIVTLEDGSGRRVDRCNWDGLNGYGLAVARSFGPGGVGMTVDQTSTIVRDNILGQWILGLTTETRHTADGSTRVERALHDIDGRPVERRAYVDWDEDYVPADCYHADFTDRLVSVPEGTVFEATVLTDESRWPSGLTVAESSAQCSGLLDPLPPPGYEYSPDAPWGDDEDPTGHVKHESEYYGGACDPDGVGPNARQSFGLLRRQVTSGGDGGAQYVQLVEWTSGVRSATSFEGFDWRALDLSIDAATGLKAAERTTSGVETRYRHDALGRPTLIAPQATIPAPAGGAARLAPTTITYTPDHRRSQRSRGGVGAPAGERIDSWVTLDSLGRVERRERQLESGTIAAEVTEFDLLDRPSSVSVWIENGTVPFAPIVPTPPATVTTYGTTDSMGNYLPDPLGRACATARPDGATTTWSYSGTTRTATTFGINDRSDASSVRITTAAHDQYGRITQTSTVDGGGLSGEATASYEYGPGGQVVSVDLDGQQRHFDFDALGRLTRAEEPEAGATNFLAHDALGNLLDQQDAAGTRLIREYDDAGRLLRVLHRMETLDWVLKEFEYDGSLSGPFAAGRLTAAASGPIGSASGERYYLAGLGGERSAVEYSLVDGGRTERWRVEWTRDALGGVEELTYPWQLGTPRGPSVVYERQHGLLTALEGFGGESLAFDAAHHPSGARKRLVYGNGLSNVLQRDVMGRVSSISVQTGGPWLQWPWRSGDYEYDGAGRIVAIGSATDPIPPHVGESFTYDVHGRLVHAARTLEDERELSYSYDSWGNMTSRLMTGGAMDPPVVPSASCRLNFDGRQYLADAFGAPGPIVTNKISLLNQTCYPSPTFEATYDLVGNLTRDHLATYDYDPLNRLTTRTLLADGSVVHQSHDADDRRLKRTTSTGEALWSLRGPNGEVVTELKASTAGAALAVAHHDFYFAGARVARLDAVTGETSWFHADHRGSVRLISGEAGIAGPLERLEWSPFGEPLPVQGQEPAGGGAFAGHVAEEDSPSIYMDQRFHSKGLARFLTSDPLRSSASVVSPASWNRYAYAVNDPIQLVDPTGLEYKDALGEELRQLVMKHGNEDEKRAVSEAAESDIQISTRLEEGGRFRIEAKGRTPRQYNTAGATPTRAELLRMVADWKEEFARNDQTLKGVEMAGLYTPGVKASSRTGVTAFGTIQLWKAQFGPQAGKPTWRGLDRAEVVSIFAHESMHSLAPPGRWRPHAEFYPGIRLSDSID